MAYFWREFLGNFKSDKFVAAILICACFFVYANSLLNGFVWDDEEQVVNNTVIRDWDNIRIIWQSSTFYAGGAGLSGGFYRPLVTLSYFLDYACWGLNPLGYHLAQVLFHCANVVLVFYLLKAIFKKNGVSVSRAAAFFAALVFAVHPANVESVAYASGVGETIYVCLCLAGMLLFIKSFGGNLAASPRFWAAFALIFMALLAKESAIIALVLMAAYLSLFVKTAKALWAKFIFGAAAVIGTYLFLRLGMANISLVSEYSALICLAPLWQRLLTAPYEIVSYLGIVFFPKDLSVSRHFVVTSAADPRFWGSAILLVLILGAVFAYAVKMKSKEFSFFVFWFAIALAPALNIVPLDMTIAERWLYFPIIGFLAAASLILTTMGFGLPPRKQKIALAFFMVAVIALGTRTIARNFDWRDGLTLYGHDIAIAARVSPRGSFDLENNYGVELFRAGRVDEAAEHFEISVALQPDWAVSQNNLGAVLERRGRLEDALAQYKIAAEKNYYPAHENIPGILIKMKRYDEARRAAENSLAVFSQNEKLRFMLAYLYAADNIGNDKDSKKDALYLLSLILQNDPQNQDALALYRMIQSNQKIEI